MIMLQASQRERHGLSVPGKDRSGRSPASRIIDL